MKDMLSTKLSVLDLLQFVLMVKLRKEQTGRKEPTGRKEQTGRVEQLFDQV